jgi:hypothetical protein
MGFNAAFKKLTLILLTWRIWWAPNNASKWQMGFNSAFKGLIHSALQKQHRDCRKKGKGKGKAISLHAWTGSVSSGILRLPNFKIIGIRRW